VEVFKKIDSARIQSTGKMIASIFKHNPYPTGLIDAPPLLIHERYQE